MKKSRQSRLYFALRPHDLGREDFDISDSKLTDYPAEAVDIKELYQNNNLVDIDSPRPFFYVDESTYGLKNIPDYIKQEKNIQGSFEFVDVKNKDGYLEFDLADQKKKVSVHRSSLPSATLISMASKIDSFELPSHVSSEMAANRL